MSHQLYDTTILLGALYLFLPPSYPIMSIMPQGFSPFEPFFLAMVVALAAAALYFYDTLRSTEKSLQDTRSTMLAHQSLAQQVRAQVNTLKLESVHYQRTINKQDGTIARLTCEISERNAMSEEQARTLASAQQGIYTARALLRRRNAKIDKLTASLSSLSASFGEFRTQRDNEFTDLKAQLEDVISSFAALQADFAASQDLLATRTAELAIVEAEFTDFKATHRALLAERDAEIAALKATINDNTRRLTATEQQLEQQSVDNGELQAQLGLAQGAINEAQAQLLDRDAKITDLEYSLDVAQTEVKHAPIQQTSISEAVIKGLEAKLALTEAALKFSEASFETAETDLKTAQQVAAKDRAEWQARASEHAANLEKALNQKVADAKEKAKLRREAVESTAIIRNLEAAAALANADYAALKTEIDVLEINLASAQAAAAEQVHLESLSATREGQLRAELDRKDGDLKTLQDERAEIEAWLAEASGEDHLQGSLKARIQSAILKRENPTATTAVPVIPAVPVETAADDGTWPADDLRPLLALSRALAADAIEARKHWQLKAQALELSHKLDQHAEDDLLAELKASRKDMKALQASLDAERADKEKLAAELEQFKRSAPQTPRKAKGKAVATPEAELDIDLSPIKMVAPPGFDIPLSDAPFYFPDLLRTPSPKKSATRALLDIKMSPIKINLPHDFNDFNDPLTNIALDIPEFAPSPSPRKPPSFRTLLADRTNDKG